MSARWVTMDALDIVPSLLGPGTQIGEDVVPEGKVALVFGSNDDVVAVIGTPQVLRRHVLDGLSLPIPDGVDLFDRDDA